MTEGDVPPARSRVRPVAGSGERDLGVSVGRSAALADGRARSSTSSADRLAERCRRHPLANTVAISAAVLAVLLIATGTKYETFFEGAKFVHFLLGPATVALAVAAVSQPRPGARHAAADELRPARRAAWWRSPRRSRSAACSACHRPVLASLAPKSATTPIAMSLAKGERRPAGVDGPCSRSSPAITGAVVVTPLMNLPALARLRRPRFRRRPHRPRHRHGPRVPGRPARRGLRRHRARTERLP